ncbi:MAG: hypothetical protein KJN82_02040 [Bacteroidia bacterium]|nr:hypothetical protein [Bacteroidia bacterium]
MGQQNSLKNNVYVDNNGTMRWEVNNKEVKGFGVNYSVPFAHAYRTANKLGINVKKAIDNDVYHFTRLGFDLYRLHVWDIQISDVKGNLLENEYLDAFDYLLMKLKENKINYVITPIAFWGNGWPEPDTESPGFSNKYEKSDCLTNTDAIKAQQNYLYQFLNHVNPYTGIAYKEDPSVIAFEVSNEPHHKGKGEMVTEFVKGMVDSMMKTGTKKPIFYNMSHAVHFIDDYFKGGVQGGTFQWYPTGLGYQRELQGNLLPNVNDYNMPFDDVFKKHNGAKLVYEFDAADVGRSYIYPAMARSFRYAGIQIATHFAYDPTYLAYANTEYNTHYMNLNYTPQKALSLKICSEVFHNIPMYADFGAYPQNTTFGNFKVDYLKDLAEYNSDKKFFYTNSTDNNPKNTKKLIEIAGFGNSRVVKYDGLGAYFLDKIDRGVWRLEVMPDAVWVGNPFGRNSLNKTVAVINWETHNMHISLNELGEKFDITAIDKGNTFSTEALSRTFKIKPGTYIISKEGKRKSWSKSDSFKTNKLNDFYAPQTTVNKPWLMHEPFLETTENKSLKISCRFIAPDITEELTILGYNSHGEYFNVKMEYKGQYKYSASITQEIVKEGFINYNIVAKTSDGTQFTYPSEKKGNLYDWDFHDRTPYKVIVVPKSNPIYLFSAIDDTNELVRPWRNTFRLLPTQNKGEAEYQMYLEKLFYPDNENLNAKPIYDYSFKHFIIDKIKCRTDDLNTKKHLVFKGRSLNKKPCKLQIAFVMDDGSAYGKVIELQPKTMDYTIDLAELKLVKTVTLPRPYPTFLPYYFNHQLESNFEINRIESLQFSIGPDIPKEALEDKQGVGIIHVRLE